MLALGKASNPVFCGTGAPLWKFFPKKRYPCRACQGKMLFTRRIMVYNKSMERKKIGILGGTLDPVHLGHIALLRLAKEQLDLCEAVLLPAGDPPHKHCHAPAEDRLKMARLAADGAFTVSDMEVRRKGATYTVDTLRRLRARAPESELVYIIGADTLPNLVTWREYREVFKLCSFAAARRAGQTEAVPEGARVLWLEGDPPAVSSTRVREIATVRGDLRGLTGEKVAAYIREKGLYLMNVPETEAENRLRGMLSKHRFQHTLGVRDTSERLARLHGLDAAAARVAGLLHDAAKCLPVQEQRRLAAGIADAGEMENPELLHAPAGVAVARDVFGVRDAEILAAIRCHTLGGPEMTGLMLAVFVADFIEPGREDFPGLSEARALAGTDLRAAASKCAELTNIHLKETGRAVHPRMETMLYH